MTATTERDAEATLREGSELAGRYRLERPLGEGGMGVVWEGRQITTQKPVAIKVLKGNDAADAARFLREARVAAALQHRNIVQVFDFWEVAGGGPVFMVMELLRGETLAALLARAGRLTPADALGVLMPVASAIRAAHGEGVVHRDLKPENVFLARVGDGIEVKVLDFGLAKPMAAMHQATALTHTGSVMGTPFYMSPEQVYGEKDIDGRADVWAFGVLVYECLTGVRPFSGENYGQVFRQIASGTYRPLRELVPELPPSVEAIVARMLTHDRDARIANIAEVEAALPASTMAPPAPQPTFTVPATVRMASQPPSDSSGPKRAVSAFEAGGAAAMTPRSSAEGAPHAMPAATMIAASTSVRPPSAPLGIPNKVLAALGAAAGLGLLALISILAVASMRGPSPTAAKPGAPLSIPMPTELATPAPTPSPGAGGPGPSADPQAPTAKAEPRTETATASPSSSAHSTPTPTVKTRPKPVKEAAKDKERDPLGGGRF